MAQCGMSRVAAYGVSVISFTNRKPGMQATVLVMQLSELKQAVLH